MRIFYGAATSADLYHLPNSKLWHINLYLPLIDLGHEVVSFEYDFLPLNLHADHTMPANREFIARSRPQASEELLRQVSAAHRQKPIDLFFSYFYSSFVEPEAIREIGRMGIPTVNWYCNGSYQFHLVEEIAPAYDYSLVPEKFRLEDYRRVGANPIYCQEAANPNFYKPYDDVPLEYDVTFVGQKYGNRPSAIRRLIDAGIDVRAWGPNWLIPPERSVQQLVTDVKRRILRRPAESVPLDRCGPPLTDEELVTMYSRSKISLGFSTVALLPRPGEKPIKQVRLRDFEAPMSGAFYMVEAFDELTEFFEPDREIVMFADQEELVDKVRYYLVHDVEREQIRQAGMRRARAEHTWHERFKMVFRTIGLG
jgi:spore maturation protein CgeB